MQGELWARNDGESLWTAVSEESARSASWFETDPHSGAVVSLMNGGALRMEGGTTLHVVSATKEVVDLDVFAGKIFVSLPSSDKAISIATPEGVVESRGGDMVITAFKQSTRVSVLEGSARVTGPNLRLDGLGHLRGADHIQARPGLDIELSGPERLALDGSDLRSRKQKRRIFVQGEQNSGRRLGEDGSPSSSPTPAPIQTPSAVNTPGAPRSPGPTPPQKVPSPGSAVIEGEEMWPWAIGGTGLGAGLFLLFNSLGDHEQSMFTQIPASP